MLKHPELRATAGAKLRPHLYYESIGFLISLISNSALAIASADLFLGFNTAKTLPESTKQIIGIPKSLACFIGLTISDSAYRATYLVFFQILSLLLCHHHWACRYSLLFPLLRHHLKSVAVKFHKESETIYQYNPLQ